MVESVKAFWADEEGVTAIEYGLIAALIALLIIAGASAAGTQLGILFNKIANCLASPGTGCAA